MRLSAVLIMKNAEGTLRRALESVAFCDEVIVLDSGSVDASCEIARQAGARVHERAFDDFASQKNYAVSIATGEWILSIDADEVVATELAVQIRAAVERPGKTAFCLRRRTYFLGRLLRFGGHQSDRPLRLFRKSAGRFVGQVHEEVRVDGPIELLSAPLLHHSTGNVRTYFAKLNHYTDLEAARFTAGRRPPKPLDLLFKSAARFGQKYLLQLGFADGWTGLVYAVLSGYYEFVRQSKFWQKSKIFSANM